VLDEDPLHRPKGLDREVRRGLDELQVVEAYATRLHLRSGKHRITETYTDAADALGKLGAHWFEAHLNGVGPLFPDGVEREVSRAESLTTEFIHAARRWHQDHLGDA
jgi:hypothetical protein